MATTRLSVLIGLALVWMPACTSLLLAADDPAYGPGWPQWRGPARDAVTEERITVWPPEKLWEFELGSGVSSVIAYRGRVYGMGHRDGQDQVYCLHADTGAVIWHYSYRAKSDQTSDVRFPGPAPTRRRWGARPTPARSTATQSVSGWFF